MLALGFSFLSLLSVFPQVPSLDEARIKRVESSLTEAVLLAGKPIEHYSLAERMERYHVRGLSVAVVDHYQVVWAKGYGLADVKSSRPIVADTLFQAGSISKPVAAFAAMKFVQDGKLQLDEDVNRAAEIMARTGETNSRSRKR